METGELIKPKRLTSIDGLRGIACFMVLLYHTNKNTIIDIAENFTSDTTISDSVHHILVFIFAAHIGSEWVTVFFLISGFVAIYQLIDKVDIDWSKQLLKRSARLLLPCYIVLGFIVILESTLSLFNANLHAGFWSESGLFSSGWWSGLLNSIDFIMGSPESVYGPMWAVKWIFYFSLLLPIILIGYRKFRSYFEQHIVIPYLILSVIAIIGWLLNNEVLQFLPAFFIGGNLAIYYLSNKEKPSNTKLILLLVIGFLFQKTPDFFYSFFHYQTTTLFGAWTVASLPIVFAALYFDPFEKFLNTKVLQWLGKISFSLFITHGIWLLNSNLETNFIHSPVAFLSPWLQLGFSLVIAALFYKFVESKINERIQQWTK
jgi:peptidoglycan/LPS O-acetylase OafA/YrhL